MAERIRRALETERVEDVLGLTRALRRDSRARARFRRALAVPSTGLFRDAWQFELLEHELLPALLEHPRLRVWSAGCATGEELMSLGVLIDRMGALPRAQLLGSDLLTENLETARRPRDGVPRHVHQRLRWERRDLVAEPAPGGRWSLILCRNVAIYLRPEAKATLYERLAGSLRRGGILLLGRAERIAAPAALGLESPGRNAYRRRMTPPPPFPASPDGERAAGWRA